MVLLLDLNAMQGGAVVTASHLRAGWSAGAGIEWAFARTWTVKLEYLHIDTQSELLSSGRFTYANPVTTAGITKAFAPSSAVTAQMGDLTLDTVRIGLNYTFN
jgi:outer membrane immunogenic protein